MPQMAPMNWLILFILFSVIFLLFNMINYFIMKNESSNLSIEHSFKPTSKKSMIWKW
uniref:ATP synthase complex subunit 8 n=1 Tax=Hydroscapha granulum TaxID=426698 RepID=B9ZSK8_HYDGN|nr:ATP synthase F0 subunit 8 [Hydroscapha granulum]CAM35434.1 ATP synthase F0 subunit 8 [Hydroscapha granulum]